MEIIFTVPLLSHCKIYIYVLPQYFFLISSPSLKINKSRYIYLRSKRTKQVLFSYKLTKMQWANLPTSIKKKSTIQRELEFKVFIPHWQIFVLVLSINLFNTLNFVQFIRKQVFKYLHFAYQVNISWFKAVQIFVLENKSKILRMLLVVVLHATNNSMIFISLRLSALIQ